MVKKISPNLAAFPLNIWLLMVLGLGALGNVSSQTTTTITCDSLMKMPFVGFNPDKLPDGFLDCMGGHTADVLMMKKYMHVLSATQGDDYTVGDMKHVLDSLNQVNHFRESADKIEACRKIYRRPFVLKNWPDDSLALHQCGINVRSLTVLSQMVRKPDFQTATLGSLYAAFENDLPALLKNEGEQHSSYCAIQEPKPYSYGLKAFDDPEAAFACAREKNLPVIFIFASWMNTVTKRTEEITLRDLDLFTRINRDAVLLVMYYDDPTPLPIEKQTEGHAEPGPMKTYGARAIEWSYRYLQIKHPPGIVLLDSSEKSLYTFIGEPTRDELNKLLELVPAVHTSK